MFNYISDGLAIYMNVNDIQTYAMALNIASTFMNYITAGGGSDLLLLVTFVFCLGEILFNFGDLKKIKWFSYTSIIALFVFFFTQTTTVQLVQSDPNDISANTGQTQTINNVPLYPALMLKVIYDADYIIRTYLNLAFYSVQNNPGYHGFLFDKVEIYTHLLSSKIHDHSLALAYESFVNCIFLPDLQSDLVSQTVDTMKNNDMGASLENMYNNGSYTISTAGATLQNHSQDPIAMFSNGNVMYGLPYLNLIGQVQPDSPVNHTGDPFIDNQNNTYPATTNIIQTKGQYYNWLKARLQVYYQSQISNLADSYPQFQLGADYQRDLAQSPGWKGSPPESFFTATALNKNSGVIKNLWGAKNIYGLTESAIEEVSTAAVKASTLKLICMTTINVMILLLVFAFPFVFIANFFPFLSGMVNTYLVSFIILAFAGPVNYLMECLSDLFATNTFAMNAAGAAAGLSQAAQDGIMITYNVFPWVIDIIYGGLIAYIFAFGNSRMNIIGNQAFQEATNPIGSNMSALAEENYHYMNRAYGDLQYNNVGHDNFNAWNKSLGNYSSGNIQTNSNNNRGIDINSAKTVLDYIGQHNNLLSPEAREGLSKTYGISWKNGHTIATRDAMAKFGLDLNNKPTAASILETATQRGGSIIDGQIESAKDRATMNSINEVYGSGITRYNLDRGTQAFQYVSELSDKYLPDLPSYKTMDQDQQNMFLGMATKLGFTEAGTKETWTHMTEQGFQANKKEWDAELARDISDTSKYMMAKNEDPANFRSNLDNIASNSKNPEFKLYYAYSMSQDDMRRGIFNLAQNEAYRELSKSSLEQNKDAIEIKKRDPSIK